MEHQLGEAEERLPLLVHEHDDLAKPAACRRISAKTTTRIIRRIKALTNRLLPIQVNVEDLTTPTSDILTKEVVTAFSNVAGDFADALPYCLLEARRLFRRDALAHPTDYEENTGRQMACEALARRIVAKAPIERQHLLLCTRYRYMQSDGDVSLGTSALEAAVDQNAIYFLSSAEAQRCTSALWRGHLVQDFDSHGHVTYTIYAQAGKGGFLQHLHPSRLAVPRYQNIFRIALWLLFLIAYTAALQTPEREFGVEDVILYVQWAGYLLEDLTKLYKVRRMEAISFWQYINFFIWIILGIALGYRVADLATPNENVTFRRRSFMILSCAAPLIWAKLLSIFDLFTFFGVLQVVVARMMRESAVFFALLLFLGVGFAQALTGLNFTDNSKSFDLEIARALFETLLDEPNFEMFADPNNPDWPYGLVLYYCYTFAVLTILINVLVALFASAYDQVTGSAIDYYLGFFSRKCVSAIRAPDEYVYVAPFNIVELVVLPLEFVLSRDRYAQLNRWLLSALFFPVLCLIAFYESRWDLVHLHGQALSDDAEEDLEEDPEADPSDQGVLSKITFEKLVKGFPDITSSTSSVTLRDVKALQKSVDDLRDQLERTSVKVEHQ